MITSHFQRITPFHPTKTHLAPAPTKQLRPHFECGDGWCLNGPPFEGASTYFICAKCSRESINPQNLAAVLRKENKRQPWAPKNSEPTKSLDTLHNERNSCIPGFGFPYMGTYCVENISCTNPYQTPTRKSLDKTACYLQYLLCLRLDCYDTLVLRQLKDNKIPERVKANIIEYQKNYSPNKYYEERLLQLYAGFAPLIFKNMNVVSRKRGGWVHLHNSSEVTLDS